MITAVRGPVPASLDSAHDRGVLWEASPGRFLLRVPGVATYLVESGEVTVDAAPGADVNEIERFLLTSPLAALHLQRGEPVLHASALVPPHRSRAHVFVGDSSAGKSTLALVLASRGWTVLADDITPLVLDRDGSVAVVPTSVDVVVWPDVLRHVEVDSEPYGPLGQRRRVVRHGAESGGPVSMGVFWLLVAENFPSEPVSPIRGSSRFEVVGRGAWNSRITSALMDRRVYFQVASAIASSGLPIRRLSRQRGRWTGEELANAVEAADV